MGIIPFAVGLFTASYIQNPRFKAQVDTRIKAIINMGVDALNHAGGVSDALPISKPLEHAEE